MDIAIIGIAGRFPGADSVDDLFDKLRDGIDCINPISKERIRNTALPPDRPYRHCGYLEDIDKFDYKFFGISYAEAIHMCPSQRLLLETAYQTLESSGYNIDHYYGSRTSVYTADSGNYYYYRHAEQFSSSLMTGNAQEFTAARISRHFNLLGNSVAVNTACSSSLVAIHMACNELRAGDAEYALICSVNLDLFPFDEFSADVKLASSDGRSRAFSAQADGMSFGETACAVLLRPLGDAIRDGDIIQAVIKGTAVNNNGNSSSSILAPSSHSQAAVIRQAWEKAGITPDDIGFIEAHGSGTQIGDCLEVEGLSLAIRALTTEEQHIPIATVKSNLGHCMLAAGMVGLIKTILSLKKGIVFPNLHCEELNPIIHFEQAPVYVNTRLSGWRKQGREEERFACVNSLGRSGVNSHIVVRSFNADQKESPGAAAAGTKEYLFTLSSRQQAGLRRNMVNLSRKLEHASDISLEDLSYTLNKGRKHYEHKFAFTASTREAARAQLEEALAHFDENNGTRIRKIFVVFSDQLNIPTTLISSLSMEYPEFAAAIPAGTDMKDPQIRSFAFQLAFFQLLNTQGISVKNFISSGMGKIVKATLLGQLSREEGFQMARNYYPEDSVGLISRVQRFMDAEKGEPFVLIDMGFKSEIARVFEAHSPELITSTAVDEGCIGDPLPGLLRSLYQHNVSLDWIGVFGRQKGKKIELPVYSFEPFRCWLRDEPPAALKATSPAQSEGAAGTAKGDREKANDLELLIASAFKEALSLTEISLQDNFFELGGDSLKATRVITFINSRLKADLDFEDIFDFPSVRELAGYLFKKSGTKKIIRSIWEITLRAESVEDSDNFFTLGGHSLMATQVIQKIRNLFHIELSFEHIFDHPTLEKLAGCVDALVEKQRSGKTRIGKEIVAAEKRAYYPVSYAQQRILLLEKFYKQGVAYNTPRAFMLNGSLDPARLEKAFNRLIQRQEILRTRFFFVEGQPVQQVIDKVAVPFEQYDMGDWQGDDGERDRAIRELISSHIRPFDTSKPPLLRVLVIRLATDKWVLMFDISHLVIDRQSYEVLSKEFIQLYSGLELPALSCQYRDYSVWQRRLVHSPLFSDMERFWLDLFRKPLVALDLPLDFERRLVAHNEGGVYDFILDRELTSLLRTIARQYQVTVYVLLLTSFKVLLHKLTGQEDICIGSPFSERNNPSLHELAGILLNTIVIRSEPCVSKPFDAYLGEVMKVSAGAYANGAYQFEMLLEKIRYRRMPDRNPVFDILFNSQTIARMDTGNPVAEGELTFIPYKLGGETAAFDIAILLDEQSEIIDFRVFYKHSLFRDTTIRYYFEQYLLLLKQIGSDPTRKIGDYKAFEQTRPEGRDRIRVIKNDNHTENKDHE